MDGCLRLLRSLISWALTLTRYAAGRTWGCSRPTGSAFAETDVSDPKRFPPSWSPGNKDNHPGLATRGGRLRERARVSRRVVAGTTSFDVIKAIQLVQRGGMAGIPMEHISTLVVMCNGEIAGRMRKLL